MQTSVAPPGAPGRAWSPRATHPGSRVMWFRERRRHVHQLGRQQLVGCLSRVPHQWRPPKTRNRARSGLVRGAGFRPAASIERTMARRSAQPLRHPGESGGAVVLLAADGRALCQGLRPSPTFGQAAERAPGRGAPGSTASAERARQRRTPCHGIRRRPGA
jgi:hypothetical protein